MATGGGMGGMAIGLEWAATSVSPSGVCCATSLDAVLTSGVRTDASGSTRAAAPAPDARNLVCTEF